LPRFNRTAVGRRSLISLANVESLDDGSLDVVTRILGSRIPLSAAYSSSSASSSSVVRSARDSSNL
jgi:hypothetical protein